MLPEGLTTIEIFYSKTLLTTGRQVGDFNVRASIVPYCTVVRMLGSQPASSRA